MKKLTVGLGMLLLCAIFGSRVEAITLFPADIEEGKLGVHFGYVNSDNSKATTEDPIIITAGLLRYALTNAFEVYGYAGPGQIQNLSSGTTVDGTPLAYGGFLKYLLTPYSVGQASPIDIALTLGYTVNTGKVKNSGVTYDGTTSTLSYGIVFSHPFPLETWPYTLIPYAAININSVTATQTSGGTSSSVSESLRGIDVGIRVPVQESFSLGAEYNNLTGYTNSTTLKDSTTAIWIFSLGYTFDLSSKK